MVGVKINFGGSKAKKAATETVVREVVKEVPVVMRERTGGVSSINPLKSVYYMIKVSLAILLHGLFKQW